MNELIIIIIIIEEEEEEEEEEEGAKFATGAESEIDWVIGEGSLAVFALVKP